MELAKNPGQEMLLGLRSVRRLFVEVSELILSADRAMSDKGWDHLGHHQAVSLSNNIKDPQRWFPSTVARHYKSDDLDRATNPKFAFIGVILDPDADANASFEEPIISFGWIELHENWREEFQKADEKKGENVKLERWLNGDQSWVETALVEQVEADGQFQLWSSTKGPSENHGVNRHEIACLPLVSIGDEDSLYKNAIEPLYSNLTKRFGQD